MRDAKVPALRVRVTAARTKSFVFESKLNRETIRRTIGDVRSWGIDAARIEARRLSVMVDQGTDPREVERQQQAARIAEKAAAVVNGVTVGEVWAAYVNDEFLHIAIAGRSRVAQRRIYLVWSPGRPLNRK